MREHRYRAFYKNNQKMYQVLTLDIIDKKALIEWHGKTDNDYLRGYAPLDDIVLMQYTGLKDNNGKEIYEGDIVKPVSFASWIGIVKYSSENAAYILDDHNNEFIKGENVYLSQFNEGLEVVGNIYENPELLEVSE